MIVRLLSVLYILVTVFFFCSSCGPPPAEVYEVEGIISIDGESRGSVNNWEVEEYLNSNGVISRQVGNSAEGHIDYNFYLSNPGTYSFWLLSKDPGLQPDERFLDVSILKEEGFLIDQFQISLPGTSIPAWVNSSFEDESTIGIEFPESGYYAIRIDSRGAGGYRVDKIHLSFDDTFRPSGLGLPASTNPDINPRDMLREQPVMLPPDWVFGVISGMDKPRQEAENHVEFMIENKIPLDAFYSEIPGKIPDNFDEADRRIQPRHIQTGFDLDKDFVQIGNTEEFEKELQSVFGAGYDFLKFDHLPGLDYKESVFEVMERQNGKRGFMIGNMKSAYDPQSKEYPSMWVGRPEFEWTSAVDPQTENRRMGGLREQVEMISNPNLSTYNLPYFAVPAAGYDPMAEVENPDELYMRWTQFAAFTPVMILLNADTGESISPGEEAMETLRYYTNLRTKLFPYIYSYAHYTRQTGQSMIEGDENHALQYRFGNELLVAPIVESGTSQRPVFFPNDGLWYDYYSGRQYEGGQTWIVETSLTRMPLFVKAGSIIPHRNLSRSIRSGSNDTLFVEIYPGAPGTFRLQEDDGKSNRYRQAEFATTGFRYFEHVDRQTFTIGAMAGKFDDMPTKRNWHLIFKYREKADSVEVNGTILTEGGHWEFDESSKSLTIHYEHSVFEKLAFVIY